ncbi:MAG: hypothetical protein ACJ74U_15025 [Jatrophihabitantaceae bacterium]
MRGVVSFADPVPHRTADGRVLAPGHVGTIYRAAGAAYAGPGDCVATVGAGGRAGEPDPTPQARIATCSASAANARERQRIPLGVPCGRYPKRADPSQPQLF